MKDEYQVLEPDSELRPFAIKQALVGLDMTQADVSVLRYLKFFSRQLPLASASFVHVLPELNIWNALYKKNRDFLMGDYTISEELLIGIKDKVDSYLSEESTETTYMIKEGNALEQMLNTAKEIDADLIVIGQRSDSDSHGILAKNLARKTKANALVIPQNAQSRLAKILVPIDFSPHSVKALQMAIEMHRQLAEPSRIICLNVYNTPDFSHYQISRSQAKFKEIVEGNIREGFGAFLHTHAGDYKDHIEVALREKDGPGIAHFIMDYSRKNGVDFLVMGAKGHSKVELLLLGSVTEKLLHLNDYIPTLIVKE